jgi:hypothetical protein
MGVTRSPRVGGVSEDVRFDVPAAASERELLELFLEFQRTALERKCAGTTDAEFCSQPVSTSPGMSLAGLVRHLATVERWYFRAVVAADFPGSLYDHESDEAFAGAGSSSHEEAFGVWRREVAAARDIAAAVELDTVVVHPATGKEYPFRWVLLHMIDEYARHLGHADLLREAIDGTTGE